MTTVAAPAIDWDAWRAAYDDMTFVEQQEFYDRVFEQFPDQARYSVGVLGGFLAHIGRPVGVAELGGWDGGFAETMLAESPQITRWVNHEISTKAAEASAEFSSDARYQYVALWDWYWNLGVRGFDVFVASHVVEHLRLRDVLATFATLESRGDALDCRWVYLQAPLEEEATDWTGYRGSHILEVGWRVLTDELANRGYVFLDDLSEPTARCFERTG